MSKQKKLCGEELVAKILEEFARITEESGEEVPYTVSLHVEETDPGLANVPGVKIHNEFEDPVFVPDFEGLTEEEIIDLTNELAENFLGMRHAESWYYVIVDGEDTEAFEDFSSAWRFAESMFMDWLIGKIKREIDTKKFEKDEFGNWRYKVCCDVDESILADGPIIEKREKIWWGERE